MDKKIVTCISATINYNSKGTNLAFTLNNLSTFCYNINKSGIYIYDNFSNESTDIVGKVLYGTIIDRTKLLIVSEVYKELPYCYIVPGFEVIDTEHGKYTEVILKCMGAVHNPIDINVTIFKELTW